MAVFNKDSIFFQDLATVLLIQELNNNDLLDSDFYNNMDWKSGEVNKENVKKILGESGLGNPAMLQMLFYALLIMPKEAMPEKDMKVVENQFNQYFQKFVINNGQCSISSTYKNEKDNDIKYINFYRHIRNAVAHSNCYYENKWGVCSVRFEDINPRNNAGEKCEIQISTYVAGELLNLLMRELMKYSNTKIPKV